MLHTRMLRTFFSVCTLHALIITPVYGFSLDTVTGWLSGGKDEEVFIKEYALNNPSKGTVEITNIRGDITVSTWSHKKVMVQVSKNGTQNEIKETEVSIAQSPSSIKINAEGSSAQVNYTIIQPADTTLKVVVSGQGTIKVKGTTGKVYTSSHKGDTKLYDNRGQVTAHAESGNIKIKLDHTFNSSSSLFLKNVSGDVILQALDPFNAQFEGKTHKGKIASDEIAIMLDPQKTVLSPEAWKRMQKEVKGSFGSGGAPITIDVENGDIKIEKRQ